MRPAPLSPALDRTEAWPALPYAAWRDTLETVHLWSQIVGKVRLVCSVPENHFWHAALRVGPRGLTTGAMPHGAGWFEIELDFLAHNLEVRDSGGGRKALPLFSRPVAEVYLELMGALAALGIDVRIRARPDEVPDPIPFAEDHSHTSYDPDAVARFHRALLSAQAVLSAFRAGFVGKASPVQFFWGSFDLTVSLYSGRPSVPPPSGNAIFREAESHENFSAGFWPGSAAFPAPAFFAYAFPEPPGLRDRHIRPAGAAWHEGLREFVFPWDEARRSLAPSAAALEFLQSAYEAAADLARWDRPALERTPAARASAVAAPQPSAPG